MDNEELKSAVLRPADMAKRLSVSIDTLARLEKAGKIPAPVLRAGRVVRWSRAEVEAWLKNGSETGISPCPKQGELVCETPVCKPCLYTEAGAVVNPVVTGAYKVKK
ncbi:MAG: hypothetical protein AMXMBFR31_09850 [Candidatus Desulfobacillus denitrificans]|nr:excisionase family DNA-binding protein [Burkholderiales bacterium]